MDDLFNDATEGNLPTPTDPKVAFETLVGEGKKFKTPEDLAKGKVEADNFILRLQAETHELRKELNSRLTAEQLLDKINERNQALQNAPVNDVGNQPASGNGSSNNGQLTEEHVAQLVQAELQKHQSKTREQANIAVVQQELRKNLGDNYSAAIETRIQQLGISKEDATKMAMAMPKAFIELMGTNNKSAPKDQLPPRGFLSQTQGDRPLAKNFAYFENLRRADLRTYLKPSTQNEMHRLAQEHGDNFYR